MRYTVDDIPYLVGLHFVLVNNEYENDTVFLIESYRRRQVRVDWPNRRSSQDMAIYGENGFLFHLNSGHWKIIDLPDISSLVNEEKDSSSMPKVDDVLVAKHDVFFEDGAHERFVTKDKRYRVIDVESLYSNNDRCVIINDMGDTHSLSLGYINKHFYILDGSISMEDVFNQLYESTKSGVDNDVVLLFFDPPISKDRWTKVIESLKILYPKLRWRSGHDLDYKPNGLFDFINDSRNVNGLTIENQKKFSYGNFSSIDNMRNYFRHPVQNGWEFLGFNTDTTSIFDSLYESEDVVKERGIILKFNPRPTPEQEKMIYARLTEMYPSIRWSSSGDKLSTRSYSRLKLDTLFIENKKHVTWGAGPDADEVYLESPHYWDLYDGWNFINGKSTSEIFDTLYEQEDDGLGWAKETVKTPITLGSLWEYKTLNVGDVVALYGDVMDSERVLFILTGENFVVEDIQYKKEVYRIGDNLDDINRILFKWLKPIQERPINWKSAASGNSFEVDSSTISNDGKILVQFISRAQKE